MAILLLLCCALAGGGIGRAADLAQDATGLSVHVDEATGGYEITLREPAWTFGGTLGVPLKSGSVRKGSDNAGEFQEFAFEWQSGPQPLSGAIRLYAQPASAVFSIRCGAARAQPPPPFPDFTRIPKLPHGFSHRCECFAPPVFRCVEGCTPWLLFDDHANAVIVSPASHFFPASMIGDGQTRIASGFNEGLKDCPAGFRQETLMAFGSEIGAAWEAWGETFTALQFPKGHRRDNDADPILKYFGYWTDNGSAYYYSYEPARGYAGTLDAVVKHYAEEKIPLRYMQLDSWWYPKTFTGPGGVKGGPKNRSLPAGEWNRYGGTLEYVAHKDVFPDGLAAFNKATDLPLVTHNRWIDPASPYRQKYKFAGLAAVDPGFWEEIATFLQASGVKCYEQDWLDAIFFRSPALTETVDAGDAFLDSMAQATSRHGLTMQYCMPLPCHFLQGARYENLTSIRVSLDGFGRSRWHDALFGSQLARAVGVRPWTDAPKSSDTGSFLLAVLSAGPVGIGDAMGAEDKSNIFKATRSDGVIVKPDVPIVPMDQSYLSEARGSSDPLIASAYTEHGDRRTSYVFAFDPSRDRNGPREVRFRPEDLGQEGPVWVYDVLNGTTKRMTADEPFAGSLNAEGIAYYIVARTSKTGIAFFGDSGKFVSTGKQRIASMRAETGRLTVGVAFALNESAVTLHGCAAAAPKVRVRSGSAGAVKYEPATSLFSVEIQPDPRAPVIEAMGDPTRHATVTLEMP